MVSRRKRTADHGSKPGSDLRFDIDTLRELAGAKVFERGERYFRDDLVEILAIERDRVLALVSGSEDYRAELTGRGNVIGGHCSCPAYEDWGFCKHMVAVGLAANEADNGPESEGALSRIRAHLNTRSVAELAEMIVDLAEHDAQLFRKLELASAVAGIDGATLEAKLRKAIDGATRTRRYVDYGAASTWAAGVDEALDAVEPLASGRHAALALMLAERAIERIERAIESIDDSDGHCSGLLHRAQKIHLGAASRLRPDPVELARDLFAREMEDDYDVFHGAVRAYAEVLGESGLAEYRRLADAAWQKLPARRGRRSADEFPTDFYRLAGILDFFAEREGDVDARIALRAKDLSSPWSYLQLAEFCLSQKRSVEALRYAEEGLWIFEDGRQDERLVLFATELLAKANRTDEAEAHLWRAFEKVPSLELYRSLRKLGGGEARDRVLRFLEAESTKANRRSSMGGDDLLIRVLIEEKMFDGAWAALRKFGGSSHARDDLARATEKTHPREALEVYGQGVERLATSAVYSEAVKLVTRMAKLQSAAEHAAYLADLKERHRRKRNFMKLLG